ncbi:bifunctional folylpolyglutamate synthase/dihydrofolate synthase, partial [Candidatus Bathyarchaeota archaeon]|nr:bifunctional folylpolyglutamate synthase/dihydrofolate synthase [Candidatus Bathyarchaeota archaeon]
MIIITSPVYFCMNYKEVIAWYNETERLGSKLGLEAITILLSHLDNPEKKLKTIHVTGTNGKGSTAAMIASILMSAGFRVGLFTKPHLSTFRESVVINNQLISEKDVETILIKIKKICGEMENYQSPRHPTQFEILTALAFTYFANEKVDFAVIEVGMGGMLDATNVLKPLVAVITNVGLEHTNMLGDTKIKIATQKAGIIKPDSIVITATQDDEVYDLLSRISAEKNNKIIRVGKNVTFSLISSSISGQNFVVTTEKQKYELYMKLLGNYQLYNAATAIAAIESLEKYGINIPEISIKKGIKQVNWPGRLEVISHNPLIVVDGAKDEEAITALIKSLSIFTFKHLILIMGISSDKNISKMVKNIAYYPDIIITTNHRLKE